MNKVALVTAGGSGMGAACAKKLAADGYAVAVLSSSGKGEALAQELGGIGVTGSNQSADDLKTLVDAAMSKWGRIDALVNCAGATQFVPMDDLEALNAEDFHKVLDVNLVAPYQMARAVAPHMKKTGNGAIVHVSSTSVFTGNGSSYAYVTSKRAGLPYPMLLVPGI